MTGMSGSWISRMVVVSGGCSAATSAARMPASPAIPANPSPATSSRRVQSDVRRVIRLLVFERPESGRRAREAELGPALGDRLVDRPADLRALGELLDVAVLHAGVDQGLGAVRALFRRVLRRIEPG